MSSSGTPSLSPSSSLSSPSLRSSPFSVLFPELTQLIIEHTVPLTFQTFTYQSRQSTLRSICLVSKLFHHLARPLLLATLWISPAINRREQEGIHVKGDDKLLCRELVFETLLENWTLGRLGLAGYVGLRTLVISGDLTRFDLSTLSELSRAFNLFFFERKSKEPDCEAIFAQNCRCFAFLMWTFQPQGNSVFRSYTR